MGHMGGISDLITSVCLLITAHKIHNAPHFAFSMELGLIEINLEGDINWISKETVIL